MISLNKTFHNKLTNTISSVSLFIYLIHENSIFADYTRHSIGSYLLNTYGQNNVIVITLLFALVLFIITSIIAFIYQKTIMKITRKISLKISDAYDRLVNKIISIINRKADNSRE